MHNAECLTWNPCTVIRTVSPTLALLGVMKSLGPFGAAKKEGENTQRSSGCSCWANLARHLFCLRRETNTISCQLRPRGKRHGPCRFLYPAGCAGFIPPWREEKKVNWVDSHYWRRMGVQRVQCGASEIRDTHRANSLVLVWTQVPGWLSCGPAKTMECMPTG